MFDTLKWGMAYICPRGIGATEWSGSEKAQTQRLRRFYLLGQTVDGMRVWDIRRALQSLRAIGGLGETKLWVQAHRDMAVDALYASIFEENITRLDLHDLPPTHTRPVQHSASPPAAQLTASNDSQPPTTPAPPAHASRAPRALWPASPHPWRPGRPAARRPTPRTAPGGPAARRGPGGRGGGRSAGGWRAARRGRAPPPGAGPAPAAPYAPAAPPPPQP